MEIQRFSGIQKEFQFFPEDNFEVFKNRFFQSDLGIQERTLGRPFLFSPQDRIALMFLKNYAGVSDEKLIKQLNGDIEWQFFCDLYLGEHRIDSYKIVSQIRCELAVKLDIQQLQQTLYKHWEDYISRSNQVTMDATCYESEVRYPTDVKLLWECVEWCHSRMLQVCTALSRLQLRSKYLKWKRRYVNYSKMRRKTKKKKRRALTRSCLLWIKKLTDFLSAHQNYLAASDPLKLIVVKEVYAQQYVWFYLGVKPKQRIISLHKSYLRPIVRGKETKPVEFGAKVHKVQVGGISFIEHLSFQAFNEGSRFKHCICFAQSLTRRKTLVAGLMLFMQRMRIAGLLRHKG